MKRDELLYSREYWITKSQIELHNEIQDYMQSFNLNQTDLANKLGVSKGYISQILNGDFDHKLSKLVDLALLMDKAPIINYYKLPNYKHQEEKGILFPFKTFDYYQTQSPVEKTVDKGSKLKFKIDTFHKHINAGQSVEFKITEVANGY